VSYLLDTNVVSEWVKPRPDPGVVRWLAEIDEDRVFLSVITLAELRHGLDRMPEGARRHRLDGWLTTDLPLRFEGRLLPIDGTVADAWGKIMARAQAGGRPMGAMDAFVAATAEVHHLTLVTRNVSDFIVLGQTIINPWSQA
jgi:predicted nucleic acid-binding protein